MAEWLPADLDAAVPHVELEGGMIVGVVTGLVVIDPDTASRGLMVIYTPTLARWELVGILHELLDDIEAEESASPSSEV